MASLVEIPAAVGELIDKITILEIKVARLPDPAKSRNVRAELDLLRARLERDVPASPRLHEMATRLKAVNERIWELEDAVRDCERRGDFGADFIAAARQIYRTNDERAAVKREINLACNSEIIEEKSYTPY